MTIQEEANRIQKLSRDMIDAYVQWGEKWQWGKEGNALYTDIADFVNFRIETADSCLQLIANGKVADALGLCRSLLENYLLLKLICRGDRYFRLQTLQTMKPAEIRKYLAEQQKDLQEKHDAGENLSCLYVAEYPRENKCLMYVFEGLTSEGEPDFRIPIHYFQFQDFRPTTMRLKDEKYFDYYEPPQDVRKAQKKFRNEATFNYRHYLSYDALLQCLEINDLADAEELNRIEAHYTFLGTFLHPTHNAARELHEHSNSRDGRTALGMNRPYTPVAVLLASSYVAYLLAGIIDEIALLLESAPSKYIADAGTQDLRALTSRVLATIDYFWFLENDAPLYDRFNWAIHHVTDDELKQYGGYPGVPTDIIKFEPDVYANLQYGLTGRHSQRVGSYTSPLTH